MGIPVRFVWGVEAEVGYVGGVEAGKALNLVGKAAILVPSLQQLAPHFVEALVVLLQQGTVPLPDLPTTRRLFRAQSCMPLNACAPHSGVDHTCQG